MKLYLQFHVYEVHNYTPKIYCKAILDTTKADFISWLYKIYGNEYEIDSTHLNTMGKIRIKINEINDLCITIDEIDTDNYDKLYNKLKNIIKEK